MHMNVGRETYHVIDAIEATFGLTFDVSPGDDESSYLVLQKSTDGNNVELVFNETIDEIQSRHRDKSRYENLPEYFKFKEAMEKDPGIYRVYVMPYRSGGNVAYTRGYCKPDELTARAQWHVDHDNRSHVGGIKILQMWKNEREWNVVTSGQNLSNPLLTETEAKSALQHLQGHMNIDYIYKLLEKLR